MFFNSSKLIVLDSPLIGFLISKYPSRILPDVSLLLAYASAVLSTLVKYNPLPNATSFDLEISNTVKSEGVP